MHDLIQHLKDDGFGCYVIEVCVACIFFADDVVLLSPSRHGLQNLLDICVAYCKKYCLDFNAKKSKVMVFGKKQSEIYPLLLNNLPLKFVSEYKYLGVLLSNRVTSLSRLHLSFVFLLSRKFDSL